MSGKGPCARGGGLLPLALLMALSAEAAFFSKSDRGLRGPPILDLETGVRALSLGGAYVGVADDAAALFWNPAGLQQLPRKEFLLGHERLFEVQSHQSVGFAAPVWRAGERETWGVSASYLAVDSFDLVVDGDTVGQARPWEGMVGLSYARPFRGVAWGATGKAVRKELPGQTGWSMAMDLGLMGPLFDGKTQGGLVLANVGTPLSLGDREIQPPLALRGGVSRRWTIGAKGALLLAGQIDAPADDIAQGRMGGEYTLPAGEWRPAFRAGVQFGGALRWTAGLGLERGGLGLNYAYTPLEDLGASHRMDLSIRFGSPLRLEEKRRALLEEAERAWREGRTVKAAELLEEIRAFSPRCHPALLLSRQVNQRIEESLQPDTLFNLGHHAFQEKDYGKALDYFRKLLVLDPTYPEAAAWLKKAETEFAAERETRAREEVKRARELDVRSSLQQAREAERLERWEPALAAWRRVLARIPNQGEALAGADRCRSRIRDLAMNAEGRKETDRALSLYRTLQADLPDRDISLRLETLEREERDRRAEQARAIYREGVTAYTAGDLAAALTRFEEAARLNPEDSTIRRALERVRTEIKKSRPVP